MHGSIHTALVTDPMPHSSEVSFLERATAPLEILIVGNAITGYGSKEEKMGFSRADIACTEDRMLALGQFALPGVAGYPGDYGMQMIAGKIFACIS